LKLLFAFLILIFAACGSPKKQEVLPLATYMQQMQTEYASIGASIKTEKFEAIDFHLNNLETICNKIEVDHNNNVKLKMAFNNQRGIYLDPIIANFKNKEVANNKEALKKLYGTLTNNCKSCHTSNAVVPVFIPIEL
jgi:hypothetical protein